MDSDIRSKKAFIFILILITFTGFLIRAISCFWGAPLRLHSDEQATVNYAVDMLLRHSWSANSYNRPDQFEIKCDAFLFTVYSWLRWGKPAYETFYDHMTIFYVIGRFFTAAFGTAMIPLAASFLGYFFEGEKKKIARLVQLSTAVMIAFSPIFVQNSAYATPDIVLTFFVLLFSYWNMKYLLSGKSRYIYFCAIAIGIGITIKYPAAILVIPLAGMVIYHTVKEHERPFHILRYALISIGIIALTVFLIAPDLFLHPHAVYTYLSEERGSEHLGADGLGFAGNFLFYLKCFAEDIGMAAFLFWIPAGIWIAKKRKPICLSLLTGLIYLLCISVLALHWLRWAIPACLFGYLLIGTGIGATFSFLDTCSDNKKKRLCTGIAGAFTGVILLNCMISGVCIAKFSLLPDNRLLAPAELEKQGITISNTWYEPYTPFSLLGGSKRAVALFVIDGDEIEIKKPEGETRDFFMKSDRISDHYFAEPDRYAYECELYEGIDNQYETVYQKQSDGNYKTSKSILKNLINSLKYLFSQYESTGSTITVYRLEG